MPEFITFNQQTSINSSVVTFGNFDGLHLGHMHIIDNVINKAKEQQLKSILITFNPHTKSIISKIKDSVKILYSYDIKMNLLSKTKLDYVVTIDFDQPFSEILASNFIELVLLKYHPKLFILGYDNYFGYKGEGNFLFLKTYLQKKNINAIEIEPLKFHETIIKSSLIKESIKNSDIELANRYLDRPFTLTGKIAEGKKIGRTIGFPTANMQINKEEQIIPKEGVYSVNLIFENMRHRGLCNIGYKPTFHDHNILTVETYLLDVKNITLYGEYVTLEFLSYIRDEKKFINSKELISQIKEDIKELQNN